MTTSKIIVLGLGIALLSGCSANSDSGSEELTGTASIAITNAPADGTCIEITAAGYRTVTKSFNVAAGASTVLALNGLPLGAVTFSADAFGGNCMPGNPNAVPNWISSPVQATVAVAPPVNVALEMQRNGNASVSVDFPNEPDGASTQPPMCMAPQAACGNPPACVSLLSDPNNCGGCGVACGMGANGQMGCQMGVCSLTACNAGFANCDGNSANGCEVNVQTDVNNCGGCGFRCNLANANGGCSNGTCVIASCNIGFADCDGNSANGCETHVQTDVNNCGACGTVCRTANGTPACTNAQCAIATCNAGFADCDGNAADGCETSLQSNANCGSCGRACVAPKTCTAAQICM